MSFQMPITIAQVINGIDNKQYLLPAIQREYVWNHTKIEWLFDSIMRDYPISSFLFWKVEGETKQKYKFYSFLKNYREKFKTHNEEFNTSLVNDFMAVLDGQQRLTSLYIGLKGSYAYKKTKVWWVDSEDNIPTRHLYLNIQAPLVEEEDGRIYEFKFLTKFEYEEDADKWFKVGDILGLSRLNEFNKFLRNSRLEENEFACDTLSILHEKIFSSPLINYFEEKEQNIDKALNIFIRINSGGEPLNFSDLLMSIAIANWTERDARQEIFKLIDEVRDMGFFIKKDFVLKVFLVLYSKDIKFKVTNFSTENAKDFELRWDEIRSVIKSTFALIKSYGHTESTLTSKNALIPIIYYLYHKGIYPKFDEKKQYEDDRKIIRQWLNIVLVKRIFGGQADTILTQIRNVFTNDVLEKSMKDGIELFPKQEIVMALKGTTKDMTMDDEYLDNILQTQKDSGLAFSILSLLYPNLDIRNVHFHKDHIHPEDNFKNDETLRKLGISEDRLGFYKDPKIWNSILNLQLLDANENMSKKKKPLDEWVNLSIHDQNVSVERFCIDHLFPPILEFSNFEKFIEKRKEILKEKLKQAV
ncbi:DUF262 domain-containing protein [Mycoplasmatota bacterium WC44]